MATNIGRRVLYTLAEVDCVHINANRKGRSMSGNAPLAGQQVAATIVRDWNPHCANLQLLLDGEDAHWVTSRMRDIDESRAPGTWVFPASEPLDATRIKTALAEMERAG